MDKEEEEIEETHIDRRKQYDRLRAGGMPDKEAKDKVWPSTSAGIRKNAKEKADKKANDASAEASSQ